MHASKNKRLSKAVTFHPISSFVASQTQPTTAGDDRRPKDPGGIYDRNICRARARISQWYFGRFGDGIYDRLPMGFSAWPQPLLPPPTLTYLVGISTGKSPGFVPLRMGAT